METIDYIEAAKKKIHAKNDLDMAKKLGLGRATMSRYGSGARIIDNYTAAKIAKILQINPLRLIAQAEIEREKDQERKFFWMIMRDELNKEARKKKEPLSDTM